MKRDPYMRRNRITVCGLMVSDIQDIAAEEIGRKLTVEELQKAEYPIGDYLAYTSRYETIIFGIQNLNIAEIKTTGTKEVTRRASAN